MALHQFQLSTKELSESLAVSTRTTVRYFDELKSDCDNFLPSHMVKFEKKEGLLIIKLPTSLGVHYMVDFLRVSYIKNSVEFKLMSLLLSKKYDTVADLSDDLFLNITSAYHYLYTLEPIIQKFDMTFLFNDKTSDLNFKYQEKELRYFSYCFYWNFYKGLELPELLAKENQDKQFDKATNPFFSKAVLPSKQAQFSLIAGLFLDRQNVPNKKLELSKELMTILSVFSKNNDISQAFPFFAANKEPEQENAERLFFNIFSRIHIPDIDDIEEKQQIIKDLITGGTSLVNESQRLVDSCLEHFSINLSDSNIWQFRYHSLLVYLFIELFNPDLPDEFGGIREVEIYQENDKQVGLTNRVKAFYQDYNANKLSEKFDDLMVALLSFSLHKEEQTSLKIAIQFSKNVIAEPLMKEKICAIFNPNLIEFTTYADYADIVISDGYEGDLPQDKYFYMDSLNSNQRWEKLFSFLQKKLFQQEFTP